MHSLRSEEFGSGPLGKNRAAELMQTVCSEYNAIKLRLTKELSANLTCTVGGKACEVHTVSVLGDFLCIGTKTAEGDYASVIAPVELVYFTTVVSKKTPEKPDRAINFNFTHQTEFRRKP